MKTSYYNSQKSLEISPSRVQFLAKTFCQLKQVETDEIIFHFVDKETIANLHRKHFHTFSPTDCLSFPIDRPDEPSVGHHILGEIFTCPEVALEYAEQHQLNPYDELSLYIVHALLHLLGYEDLTPGEKKVMRSEEKRCMQYLKTRDALLDESAQS